MINDSQTNFVYLSKTLELCYRDTFCRLTELLDRVCIPWGVLDYTNDIWARDYMPVQKSNGTFLKYRYYPDYLDNDTDRVYITDCSDECMRLGINVVSTDIILDGGNIVRCGDYLVMTDKVFTENGQPEYNPEFIRRLQDFFGREIIFIPWHCLNPDDPDAERYGHSDGFIHWCGGNRVLMTDHFKADDDEASVIKRRLEEKGFDVTVMEFDVPKPNNNYNWAYVNYLQVGRKIIVPAFGIAEDGQALDYVRRANPDCEIHPFRMRDVANNGGALHCITWNILRPEAIADFPF